MNDKKIIENYLSRKYDSNHTLIELYKEKGDNGKRVSRVMVLIDVRLVLGYSESDYINEIIDGFLTNM